MATEELVPFQRDLGTFGHNAPPGEGLFFVVISSALAFESKREFIGERVEDRRSMKAGFSRQCVTLGHRDAISEEAHAQR